MYRYLSNDQNQDLKVVALKILGQPAGHKLHRPKPDVGHTVKFVSSNDRFALISSVVIVQPLLKNRNYLPQIRALSTTKKYPWGAKHAPRTKRRSTLGVQRKDIFLLYVNISKSKNE